MKLSTRARYGLRILMQVAVDNRAGKLSQGHRIAEKQNISEGYLEQLMIPLKDAGWIGTVRGCTGGYKVKCKLSEKTILDLIELFEGKFALAPCNAGRKGCERKELCAVKDVWESLTEKFRKEASAITLQEILDKVPNEEKYLSTAK